MNLSPLKLRDLPKNLIGFSLLFVTLSPVATNSLGLVRITFLSRLRQRKGCKRKLANIKATVLAARGNKRWTSVCECWKRAGISLIGLGRRHRHFCRSFADTPTNVRLLSEMVQDNNIRAYCSTIGVDMEVVTTTFDLATKKILSDILGVNLMPNMH